MEVYIIDDRTTLIKKQWIKTEEKRLDQLEDQMNMFV